MDNKSFVSILLGCVLLMIGLPRSAPVAIAQSDMCYQTEIIERIQQRGYLSCGIYEGGYAGFATCSSPDDCTGFDVEYCHAVAAAVLGNDYDPVDSVRYVTLPATTRFQALCDGSIDMLSRVTTWTISRDTALQSLLDDGSVAIPGPLIFAPTTYYDEQGVMVRRAVGIRNLQELAGATICVEAGTTTEQNIEDMMERYRPNEYPEKIITYESQNEAWENFIAGNCIAITADTSRLLAWKLQPDYLNPGNPNYPSGDTFSILELEEPISEEPLGPVTVESDPVFADVVRWTTYGIIRANIGFEGSGIITQDNVEMLRSARPDGGSELDYFLGRDEDSGDLFEANIPNDFMYHVIRAVGNYDEIYSRHLGSVTDDRGLNQIVPFGLLFSPPF